MSATVTTDLATRSFYGLVLFATSALAVLAGLVVLGPALRPGESWEVLAVAWAKLGLPTAVVLSTLSAAAIHPRRLTRTSARLGVYLGNVAVVSAAIIVAMMWGAGWVD